MSNSLFVRTVRHLFLRSGRISRVEAISPNFRLVEFTGDSLKDVKWLPGQHIQVFCNGFTHRTYTLISWNAETGHASFLTFLHGVGPGCQWARDVQEGDAIEFNGPSRSLDVPDFSRPLVLFGDETSFGLAVALRDAGDQNKFHSIFEVSDLAESQSVLERLAIVQPACIQRSPSCTHLEAAASEVMRSAAKDSCFALTGNARSIQAIKKQLAAAGVKSSDIRVKPYWAEGKTGLE